MDDPRLEVEISDGGRSGTKKITGSKGFNSAIRRIKRYLLRKYYQSLLRNPLDDDSSNG